MQLRSKLLILISVLLVAALSSAASASAWAPEATATIHPGSMTFTGGPSFVGASNASVREFGVGVGGASQCTANFVFVDAEQNVYLGQAAHCSSTGGSTETNGCTTNSLPLGTPVYSGELVNGGVQNGTLIGTLAYNSWLAMQSKHETDPNACAYNDLALIKIDPSQVSNVNPTMPVWGGPTGLAPEVQEKGERVYGYGNSILRGGVSALSPKVGVSLGETEGSGGWSMQVFTLTPGIPGDSGSGFIDGGGGALGVLSTVELAPTPASNGVGDLARELEYANTVTELHLQVERGTAPLGVHPPPER